MGKTKRNNYFSFYIENEILEVMPSFSTLQVLSFTVSFMKQVRTNYDKQKV